MPSHRCQREKHGRGLTDLPPAQWFASLNLRTRPPPRKKARMRIARLARFLRCWQEGNPTRPPSWSRPQGSTLAAQALPRAKATGSDAGGPVTFVSGGHGGGHGDRVRHGGGPRILWRPVHRLRAYYGGGYSEGCGWIRRRAQATVSRYWWGRYEDCIIKRRAGLPAPSLHWASNVARATPRPAIDDSVHRLLASV